MQSRKPKEMNGAVGYTRVSSEQQRDGTSLDQQAHDIFAYAKNTGLTVASMFRDVGSAYTGTRNKLVELSETLKDTHLIVYAVDRFSRHSQSLDILIEMINKGNRVHFVRDKFVISADSDEKDWEQWYAALQKANEESKLISERIRAAKAFAKNNGFHAGGKAPIGKKIITDPATNRKKLVDDTDPGIVKSIEFIKLCNSYSSVDTLSKCMRKISKEPGNIELFNGENEIRRLKEPLAVGEIVSLLNDFKVGEIKWTASKVSSIIKNFIGDSKDHFENSKRDAKGKKSKKSSSKGVDSLASDILGGKFNLMDLDTSADDTSADDTSADGTSADGTSADGTSADSTSADDTSTDSAAVIRQLTNALSSMLLRTNPTLNP
jgi:DNA invertase Pin-like site-specific DNA recombinase